MSLGYLGEGVGSVADELLIGFVEGPKHAVLAANSAPIPSRSRMVFVMGCFGGCLSLPQTT
jgi:hypothetical protein